MGYLTEGDIPSLVSYLGHFDYVHIRMNTFVGLRQTTSNVILMFPLFE